MKGKNKLKEAKLPLFRLIFMMFIDYRALSKLIFFDTTKPKKKSFDYLLYILLYFLYMAHYSGLLLTPNLIRAVSPVR